MQEARFRGGRQIRLIVNSIERGHQYKKVIILFTLIVVQIISAERVLPSIDNFPPKRF